MLAYVFWHWPRTGADQDLYESRLMAFHDMLSAHPSPGFRGSAVYAVDGAPWTGTPPAYEDWYLIDDFTALGALNEAAVTGERQGPHDEAAALAEGGIAGVYRLVSGAAFPAEARAARWLSKPAGMKYADFLRKLEGVAGLWQWQMTLGATTEFVVHGEGKELGGVTVSLRRVY